MERRRVRRGVLGGAIRSRPARGGRMGSRAGGGGGPAAGPGSRPGPNEPRERPHGTEHEPAGPLARPGGRGTRGRRPPGRVGGSPAHAGDAPAGHRRPLVQKRGRGLDARVDRRGRRLTTLQGLGRGTGRRHPAPRTGRVWTHGASCTLSGGDTAVHVRLGAASTHRGYHRFSPTLRLWRSVCE